MNRTAMIFSAGTLLLLGSPAAAVIIEAGFIEVSGNSGTVDLTYFDQAAPGTLDLSVVARCGPCDVITDEAVGFNLYAANPDGTPGTLLVSRPGAAGTRTQSLDDFAIAIGSYVIAVGSFELSANDLPPLQFDPNITRGFEYEIAFADDAQNDLTITCEIEGNLDGSVSRTVRQTGATCALPTSAVPEPGVLALFGFSLVGGLTALRLRKKPLSRSR